VRAATPAILLGLVMLAAATPARAQTVVTPLVSANIKTTPGFIDLDDGASRTHAGFGVAVSQLTAGWLGVEGAVMLTPSMFSGGDLVESSRLLTATGSLLVTGPARWRVRPYASLGIGLAQIESDDVAHLFAIDSSQLAASIGAGAWTWFTPRLGLRTGIDFLRTVGEVESGTFETLQLSAGVSIRF
jgi:hypothetical protein